MHNGYVDTEWFKARKRDLKVNDVKLAEALGVERSVANKVVNGKVPFNARRTDAVAALLQVSRDELLFRVGIANEPPANVVPMPKRTERSDHAPTRSIDGGETAPVLRLDLSYSMGPGRDLDDSYIEAEAFEFDLGFLRSLTITPAERIRIVDGIGDSMQPTIHDRDLLFIDTNQATLNAQDRVWAIWLFGLGAVKRLRALDAEKVLVMSDNPDVENQVVNRSDIIISGRVVGSIKRH
ncbi:LexA family transcriptional regulator [Sphingomonas sp. Leaf10]|uniref:LexA family transcriptional regulator n=1 Tax=Sphingomonas sp. Leaf10 TaxID=1735676 RepID=UPI000A6753BE|nr:LexA family transcriptional regulator [Sphingomonas sp. Leaf10]